MDLVPDEYGMHQLTMATNFKNAEFADHAMYDGPGDDDGHCTDDDAEGEHFRAHMVWLTTQPGCYDSSALFANGFT